MLTIVADMHTHTIASGHGYSTLNELAAEASRKGLQALAITDHGPALPGGPHLYHFGAMRFIPRLIAGVRIIPGVEANIIHHSGQIDIPDEYFDRLDFIMAGFHEGCGFDNQGITANTEALVNAMRNPRIKAVSHPGNPLFPVDYAVVVAAASATGTALEINNSSLTVSRKGSRPRCELLATLLAESGAPVIVGSDAHIAQGVGEFSEALQLLAAVGITEQQVVNSSLERLSAFLAIP
jgi:putative hydrolase